MSKTAPLNLQENPEERFVAFIDVMGFKDLVRSGKQNMSTWLPSQMDKLKSWMDRFNRL